MKKQITWIIIGVVALFLIIYFAGQNRTSDSPTLNDSAILPDRYLRNVDYYEQKDRHSTSAFNLERAIQSIWKIESDVDDESYAKLERAIERLEEIHTSILRDSVDSDELRSAFEFALNNLAHAELEIAEMYAETNHIDKANVALKYAQLHIKNAMLFHQPYWDQNEKKLAIEKNVFEEIDSLIENNSVSPVEYTLVLDKMIKEIDQIIEPNEN
ncbi:hypothetical protein [Ekhidna sp.]|jgi:hypothetical protein|uniref:hypothetical protein n=1 Tax=Ekhidna sp. TaxID=2608089 RepID=UPI0032ED23F0